MPVSPYQRRQPETTFSTAAISSRVRPTRPAAGRIGGDPVWPLDPGRDIAKGDVKGAVISAALLAVDVTAAALPGVPGGAGIARQTANAAVAGGKVLTAAQKAARSAAIRANFLYAS